MARPIAFLTDYGYADEFAGVCRAVMARIAPDARITDISHGVAPHDVQAGALMLARALPFAAPGVHLAVVDPGVGTDRRAVALRTRDEDRLLVGPDNGLLHPAAERFGGAAEAADVSRSAFALAPVSPTFHGRDLFAPVAAHLASGAELSDAGTAIDPAGLVRLEQLGPREEPGRILAHVAHIDGFGNATLDVMAGALERAGLDRSESLRVESRGGPVAGDDIPVVRTFGDVRLGEPLLFVDSSAHLALAVNGESAAVRFEFSLGAEIVLRATQ